MTTAPRKRVLSGMPVETPKLIVSDGVFSTTGTIADVPNIDRHIEASEKDLKRILDEAVTKARGILDPLAVSVSIAAATSPASIPAMPMPASRNRSNIHFSVSAGSPGLRIARVN